MTPDAIRLKMAQSHRNGARNIYRFCARRVKHAKKHADLALAAEDANQPQLAKDHAQEVADAYAAVIVFEDKARSAAGHVRGFSNQIEERRISRRACYFVGQAEKYHRNIQKIANEFYAINGSVAHIPTLNPTGTEADEQE